MLRSAICVLSLLLPLGCGDDAATTDPGSTGDMGSTGDPASSTGTPTPGSTSTAAPGSSSSGEDSTGSDASTTSDGGSESSTGAGTSGGPAECVAIDLDWQETTALPDGIGQRGRAVIVGDRLYVAGGISFTTLQGLPPVYATTIEDDGSLGAWEPQAPLPGPGYSQQLVVTGEQLWVVGTPGGPQPVFGGFQSAFVWRAEMDEGEITAWTPMPSTLANPDLETFVAFGYGGRIYVAGGAPRFAGQVQSAVHSAPVLGDRGLGAWTEHLNALPSPMMLGAAITTETEVFIFGGEDPTPGEVGSVDYRATIFQGGAPGTWASATALPERSLSPALAQAGERILAIGGATPGANEQPEGTTDQVYSTLDGTSWTAETSLPAGRAFASAAANDQFVFVIGGTTAPPLADSSVLVSAHCSFE